MIAVLVVWLGLASLVCAARYGGAGSGDYGTVSVREYAAKNWGVQAPISTKAVLEYPTTTSTVPVVRLINSYKDAQTRKWLNIELMSREGVQTMELAYDIVEWTVAEPGVTPTAEFTLDDAQLDVWLSGHGFSLWRFMTFRGAPRLVYEPDDTTPSGYSGRSGETLARFIQNHAVHVRIAIPNDPSWLKLKEIS